jgi:hypothetical protein
MATLGLCNSIGRQNGADDAERTFAALTNLADFA